MVHSHRNLLTHMVEELGVNDKLHRNDDWHTKRAQKLGDCAARFRSGHWIFVSPSSESTWRNDRTPNEDWNQERFYGFFTNRRLGECCRQTRKSCSVFRVRLVRDLSCVRNRAREICLSVQACDWNRCLAAPAAPASRCAARVPPVSSSFVFTFSFFQFQRF